MSNELALITKASQMLAEAKTISELKQVRDVGRAAIDLAKNLRTGGFGALYLGTEIVLTAERRMGKMLDGMDKKTNQKGAGNIMLPALADLGITKTQSSRWQSEAAVPEEQFTEWLNDLKTQEKFPTSNGLIKLGRQQAIKPDKSSEIITGTVDSLQSLIDEGKKFACIYADPPWKYGNQATRSSTDNHYGTMTIEEICAEPVAELTAELCHLYLWTTSSFLRDAFDVIDAWGFDYKSNMVWIKPQMGIGNYVRLAHEHLLIAVKGNTRTDGKSQMSWIQADRTKHSRKPGIFREVVNKMSPGPYLEMYGREKIDGWVVFGNQIEKTMFQ